MREKKKRLNEDIRANQVQVIHDSEGNLGEMSFKEALERAREEELDLMEIGQNGDIVIVKMIDYGKHLYRTKKQEQKQKQKGKSAEMKTIRLTYKIGEHDLEVKKKQVEKFFEDGNPLKVTLMLRGRENHYGDLASEKINKFVQSIEEIYKLDNPVKRMGNTFHAMLKPKK
ncbi:translation initiation factor IF-3 [Candidatus Gracilibacteria bacterium]|nr:translation initiation factor IF-3 [Candidatus Gracilibacteria bacterium]